MLVKLLSFALIHFLPWYEREDSAAFSAIILPADLTADSKDESSNGSHAIVSQRQCNITVLREMIAIEFYGLQWERWVFRPRCNGIVSSAPRGLPMHKWDYNGKTVYFCFITTVLFSIIFSLYLYKWTILCSK